MNDYRLTVGLEIHAELKTRTKMFCDSKNDPDEERPNVNVCPICLGHPGTLPVINMEAVKRVLRVGLALGGTLADFTEFDRKNYFYPDIPKGYQISQYKYPLVSGGELNGVSITRVHLEEDTGTSLHMDTYLSPFLKGSTASSREGFKSSNLEDSTIFFKKGGGSSDGSYSLVNFNRAGVPLMELVTEPVIRSAKEAGNFARELQLLLRYLGVSDANMEKGEMRVEANISVARATNNLGTKVEVKNLNSFRSVERAIEYETKRHVELLETGEKIVQETRGWDEDTGKTFSQRGKEEAHDYRYFPDPDLPKLQVRDVPEFAPDRLRNEMPELPQAKRKRYSALGLKGDDVETLLFNRSLAALLEEVLRELTGREEILLASNYLTSDLMGLIKKTGIDTDVPSSPARGVRSEYVPARRSLGAGGELRKTLSVRPRMRKVYSSGTEASSLRDGGVGENCGIFKFTPSAFAELIRMVRGNKLSSRGAKDILQILFEKGGAPEALAKERGLLQKSDSSELKRVVEDVIAAHPKVAQDYKNGKMPALQFLVGQGMKATRGAANPEVLRKLFASLLK